LKESFDSHGIPDAGNYYSNINAIVNFFLRTSESGFLFCSADHYRLIQEVNHSIIQRCKHEGKHIGIVDIDLKSDKPFLAQIESLITEFSYQGLIINLISLIEQTDGNIIYEVNFSRETFISLKIPFLFWMNRRQLSAFANEAPDTFLRRERSVIYFEDVEFLENFHNRIANLEWEDAGLYNFQRNLNIKIALLESQLIEAEQKSYPLSRIRNDIVWDLLESYLQFHLAKKSMNLCLTYELKKHANKTSQIINIGRVYLENYLLNEAIQYFEKALKITGVEEKGLLFQYISQVYFKKGHYDLALSYLENSLTIQKEIGSKSTLGSILNNIGHINYVKGDYKLALKYFKQSLNVKKDIGDAPGESTTINNIAQIYYTSGNYKLALTYLQQSLDKQKNIGDPQGMGTTLTNIGQIFFAQNEYAKASTYWEQSLRIYQEVGDRYGEAMILNNISQIYKAKKEYNHALRYLTQSQTLFNDIGHLQGLAMVQSNIAAILYKQKKDFDTIIPLFWEAFQSFQKTGSPQAKIPQEFLNKIKSEIGEKRYQEIINNING
jgi:tetratricopeptide (TPR) repeat protein